ncbi:MAG: carboxypeptidase regulatory-like domain-containing protein [Paludibacteraceae bacterium]|nr:carboxypeptidase regulatory-like domain-containing protein [Paludibacteraceae bacterium]
MRRIYFLLITLLTFFGLTSCSLASFEQSNSGSIYGIVVEANTNEPLSGLSVELYKVEYKHNSLLLKTVTSSDGHFEFTDLKSDEYLIKVIANDYDDSSTEYYVTVESGRQSRVDMMLLKTLLRGMVVDSQNGAPISGALVSIKSMIARDASKRWDVSTMYAWGYSSTAFTDASGRYEFTSVKLANLSEYALDKDDVPAERFSISIEAIGYYTHGGLPIRLGIDQWESCELTIQPGVNEYNARLRKL